MSTKLKLLGIDVGAIGNASGQNEAGLSFVYLNPQSQVYKRLVTSDDGRRLLGAALVGDCDDYDTLLQYYLNDLDLPDDVQAMIVPGAATATELSPAALPDSAFICGCHQGTKGAINAAIQGGCRTRKAVQDKTQASTGCGGCAGSVEALLQANERLADSDIGEDHEQPRRRAC